MLTRPTDRVDFRKLLRDVLRGALVESDHIPVPMGGPISPDDTGDELAEQLTQEEYQAVAELVREVKAEAVAAGETRQMVLADIDTIIAECVDASGS
jgi:hypothetical protein